MATQFKLSIIADWGRGEIAKRLFAALKQRQSNLVLREYRMYRWEGEPFLNVAILEVPTPVSLLNVQIFILKTTRSLYNDAPFVVLIEEWDGEPLPDSIGPYIAEGAFDAPAI